MNKSAYPKFKNGTAEQRTARDLLINAMQDKGFTVFKFEWWHFDFKGWESYPIQDIPFSAIK